VADILSPARVRCPRYARGRRSGFAHSREWSLTSHHGVTEFRGGDEWVRSRRSAVSGLDSHRANRPFSRGAVVPAPGGHRLFIDNDRDLPGIVGFW